ncbi:hypothetical protein Hanom_Chr10g00938201 [Helianthus anomalus]
MHRSATLEVQTGLAPEVQIYEIVLQVEQLVHRAVHRLHLSHLEILRTMKSEFHLGVKLN